VDLRDGRAAAAYARRGRWAVTAGDVVAPPDQAELALSEYIDELYGRRLTPAFVAVRDPVPYRRRGLSASPISDEAIVDLDDFDLSGSARAGVRHAASSAQRLGITVERHLACHDIGVALLSEQWLRTKRGGEYGFTLSRHDDVAEQVAAGNTDSWVALDRDGIVQAWCTWRHYAAGSARVLDVMRRNPDAPNPAMDYLLATTLLVYRDLGVRQASLASVPRDQGGTAERFYPTRSLRAFKQKFAPRWERRWLVVPSAWQRPLALAAIGRAYTTGGLRHALSHNS
jgi:phosphatidylglycerol lysyltransferase